MKKIIFIDGAKTYEFSLGNEKLHPLDEAAETIGVISCATNSGFIDSLSAGLAVFVGTDTNGQCRCFGKMSGDRGAQAALLVEMMAKFASESEDFRKSICSLCDDALYGIDGKNSVVRGVVYVPSIPEGRKYFV